MQVRRRLARQQRGDETDRPARNEETDHGADDSEHERLREELSQQLGPGRAEGKPDRELGRTVRRAREQQVGDVGAGDEQHDARGREQQDERRFRTSAHVALSPAAVFDGHLARTELRHGLVAQSLLERHLHRVDDGFEDQVQTRPRLFNRGAWLESAEQVHPVPPPVGVAVETRAEGLAHRDRDECHRPCAEHRPLKVARGNADDGERLSIDDEDLVDHGRIRAEIADPERVTEDRDVVPANGVVVVRREKPTERRPHAEHRDVGSGDIRGRPVQCLRAVGDIRTEDHVRRDAAQRSAGLLEVAEHRIAEHDLAVAGLTTLMAARSRTRRSEIDEAMRFGHRHRCDEHLIERRVDRGVRTDPERE